jgi:hypothetical protein
MSKAPARRKLTPKARKARPAPTLATSLTPTDQTYGPLQSAFVHFNRELFGGSLPHCLITLQRKANTKGYYSRERFAAIDGDERTDEIAMNPQHFRIRPARDTASTLVHEMAHLWQFHHGTPRRAGYHDKQWAAKMTEIGLMPSTTGAPGGKTTGYRVTHYILDDGAFAASYRRFEATGQTLGWGDAAELGQEQKPRQTRMKFVCPTCGDAAWGKASLDLTCNPCGVRLELAD